MKERVSLTRLKLSLVELLFNYLVDPFRGYIKLWCDVIGMNTTLRELPNFRITLVHFGGSLWAFYIGELVQPGKD